MATKTKAAIPAETAIAQHSEYDAALPIADIHPHPHNIRHNATADDELVASVAEQGLLQPLVVTPDNGMTTGLQGGYLLIAGHRRLDALTRAGYTHTPAVIRHDLDTEADQIAAMLVENGRRADLTPIEEAEGFDLLAGLDWSVEDIATVTGRSKTLINERRKLTRLKTNAKAAVDTGQVTIDDALRIAKLPASAQSEVEKAIGGRDFKVTLDRVAHRVQVEAELDTQAKQYQADGVPQVDQPKGIRYASYLTHAEHGMVYLPHTGEPNASDHDGCLAFVRFEPLNIWDNPSIVEVCTDPGKHDAELTEAQLARKAEQEAASAERVRLQAERTEREQAQNIARQLRVDDLVAGIRIKPSQVDPVLEAITRIGLSLLINRQTPLPEEAFRSAISAAAEVDLADHVRGLTGSALFKALAAYLALDVELLLSDACESWGYNDGDVDRARVYLGLLDGAGHERNTLDVQLLDEIAKNASPLDKDGAA